MRHAARRREARPRILPTRGARRSVSDGQQSPIFFVLSRAIAFAGRARAHGSPYT
jgi:hypothetical protein